jgi:hypothetical protein
MNRLKSAISASATVAVGMLLLILLLIRSGGAGGLGSAGGAPLQSTPAVSAQETGPANRAPIEAPSANADCTSGQYQVKAVYGDAADPTISNRAEVSTLVVIGKVVTVDQARWNTDDGSKPAPAVVGGVPVRAMIYRSVTIATDTVIKGTVPSALDARWLGGQIGCDFAGIDIGTTVDIKASGVYAFFMGPSLNADGTMGSTLTIIEAWPVANGLVETPMEGKVPEAGFTSAVKAAPGS